MHTQRNAKRLSVDEFERLDEEEGNRLSLVRGQVVREPAPGGRHVYGLGRLCAVLHAGPRSRFLRVLPDLAVEIVSPSNREGEMRAKVADYLATGGGMVWVVNARRRAVQVHRLGQASVHLTEQDTLAGDEVLPGLQLPVKSGGTQPCGRFTITAFAPSLHLRSGTSSAAMRSRTDCCQWNQTLRSSCACTRSTHAVTRARLR